MPQLGGVALVVLDVAEGDGPRRACLLAGGPDVAVAHRSLFVTRVVLAGHDALDAHRALLHDTELADGHVGIELDLERLGPLPVVPVEPPHVIWTVVAAIARAHTPAVDLPAHAFVGPIRGEHGTHRLAPPDPPVPPEAPAGEGFAAAGP